MDGGSYNFETDKCRKQFVRKIFWCLIGIAYLYSTNVQMLYRFNYLNVINVICCTKSSQVFLIKFISFWDKHVHSLYLCSEYIKVLLIFFCIQCACWIFNAELCRKWKLKEPLLIVHHCIDLWCNMLMLNMRLLPILTATEVINKLDVLKNRSPLILHILYVLLTKLFTAVAKLYITELIAFCG